MMQNTQPSILSEIPRQARYLIFSIKPENTLVDSLRLLSQDIDINNCVVGFGQSLISKLDKNINGLKDFPVHEGENFSVPATPVDLWIWLRGDDRGVLLHQTRHLEKLLKDSFSLDKVIDAFQYEDSRDLTGYEDGTENPQGDDAIRAAFVQGQGEGLDGSSFVAVQQWVHNLNTFEAMPPSQQDDTIGRRISDNEEIDEAPSSAHVKRTAQEDFDPEAFVLRRSMPWSDNKQAGLIFVAFGFSVDAFEALLNRMTGKDDGVVDALFTFTQPVSGSYFWCPPVKDNQLDLSALYI